MEWSCLFSVVCAGVIVSAQHAFVFHLRFKKNNMLRKCEPIPSSKSYISFYYRYSSRPKSVFRDTTELSQNVNQDEEGEHTTFTCSPFSPFLAFVELAPDQSFPLAYVKFYYVYQILSHSLSPHLR